MQCITMEKHSNQITTPWWNKEKAMAALIDKTYFLPAESKSDAMLCLQSYQGLRINKSLVY